MCCGPAACDAAHLAREHGYPWHAIETWRHDDAQYGNALLTTLPVESTQVHELSVGRHDPRAALEAHIPWRGSAVAGFRRQQSAGT